MMQFTCSGCKKDVLFYEGHEPKVCGSCGKKLAFKGESTPVGFSPGETKAMAEFMEESYSLDGCWEAIHTDIRSGEDPDEVIKGMRDDPQFQLYWRLTGGKKSGRDSMERWLSDAKTNAIELRDENPPENRITIVTMYRCCDAETFTAAVKGVIPEEDRQDMSTRFGMAGDDGMPDNMFFSEFDVGRRSPSGLQEMRIGYQLTWAVRGHCLPLFRPGSGRGIHGGLK
jgi:hypothetical protein